MIPNELREAIEAARQRRGVLPQSAATGGVNEIAVVEAPRGSVRRIVAIASKDEANQTVQVFLIAPEIEQATDLDLIIEPRDEGLPFSFMVQGELYGAVFTEQLLNAIGSLLPQETAAIAAALETDGESLQQFTVGPPLAGPDDIRRAFKDAELEDLEELVAECRSWMMGAPAQREVPDPAILLPPPPGAPQDVAETMYLELLSVLDDRHGPLVLPSELLAIMGEAQLLHDLGRWHTDFGLDVTRVLARIHIPDDIRESALEVGNRADHGAEDRSLVVLRDYLAYEARAGTLAIDVRSTPTSWTGGDRLVVVQSSERFCRGRIVLPEAA